MSLFIIKPRYGGEILLLILIAADSSAYVDDGVSNNSVSDKSSYNLLNPTPDDKLRSFCTDRPTKSNSACTVDVGHFQYEADAFNWTYNHNGSVTQNTYLYTNPTFKVGLTNRSDIEFNIAPFEEINTHDKSAHTSTDLTGVGDLYARFKYNLIGNEGGNTAITLLPYVKIPTAEPGIGNKQVESGIIVPVTFTLPKKFTLLFDPEFDAFKNSSDSGYHDNYQMLANVSHTIFKDNITGYVELWSDVNNDPAGAYTQASFDVAVSWVLHPNLQFDVGTNIGLTNKTPDLQSYAGISQRF
jgi:hypothetical protein